MLVQSLIWAIEQANGGKAFIAASVQPSAVLKEALTELARELGCHGADRLTVPQLVALYAIARKNPAAAQRKAESFNALTAPVPVPTPVELPRNGEAVTYDDAALVARIAELEALVRSIEVQAPRKVEVRVQDLPSVEFDHVHPRFDYVLSKLARKRHVWLKGPRGSGKSFAAEQLAQALGVPFYIMTAADSEFAFQGYERPHNGSVVRTPFHDAWENGGLILLDEFDTYNPNAVSCFNDAMSNGWMLFPDGRKKKHVNCYIMAGTNTDGRGATIEYNASQPLTSASRDRFCYIVWDYDEHMELGIGKVPSWTKYVQAVRAYMADNAIAEAPSPRASYTGGEDIMHGDTWEAVAHEYIWRGMADDIVARINRAVPISQFRGA